MTISTHTYTATLLGPPDKPLSIKGGRVSLDVARFPHVEASLTVPVTDAAILADLDPREPARIRIDAVATSGETPVYSAWTEARRNRARNPRGTASGYYEEYQTRYSWPRTTMSGTTAPFTGGPTTGLRLTCPSAQTGAGRGFDIGGNADIATPGTTGAWLNYPVTPGVKVTVSGWARSNRTVAGTSMMIRTHNGAGAWIGAQSFSAARTMPGGVWTFFTHTITPATGATHLVARITLGSIAWAANDVVDQTAVYIGAPGDYFDGLTDPNGTLSRTRWTGTANASASVSETRAITGYTPNPLSSRSFDLSLRAARPNRATGDIELRLSSDEAVLQDFGPDVDDDGARDHEDSVRAVTAYVLDKIGATLEPGTDDADVTARWSAQNMLLNPEAWSAGAAYTGAGSTTIDWNTTAGQGVGGTTGFVNGTSTSANTCFIQIPQSVSVRKGQMFTLSGYAHRRNGEPALNGRLRVYEIDAGGAIIRQIESAPKTIPEAGTVVPGVGYNFERFSLTFTIENPNATKIWTYFRYDTDAANRKVGLDSLMLTEGPLLLDYFSGSSTPAGYVTNWTGQNGPVADNSVSERKPVDGIERLPDVFTWRAGMGGVDFLSPILQSKGFRLVCDGERKWTLRRDEYRTPGMLTLAYGVNIIGADEEVSRESEDWFDAAVYTYRWTTADGTTRSQDDVYAPAGYTKMIRREIDRPYPGPGRAEYAVKRALNKGRTLTVETVSDWTASTDQDLLVRLDGTPTQLGTTDRVEFDLNTDRMRVSSRTADVPEGAINLLPSTIDALPGTINAL
ncbi:hypothetical protein ACTJJ4_03080 [Microbacterium sp. 22195]|uniref:hypothetical protein n=1 Tax=Microbacterium sp. 22195 TaxID=3453891 RepID=UPI003F82B6B0